MFSRPVYVSVNKTCRILTVIYLRPLLYEIPNRPNFIFGAKTPAPLPSGALTIDSSSATSAASCANIEYRPDFSAPRPREGSLPYGRWNSVSLNTEAKVFNRVENFFHATRLSFEFLFSDNRRFVSPQKSDIITAE